MDIKWKEFNKMLISVEAVMALIFGMMVYFIVDNDYYCIEHDYIWCMVYGFIVILMLFGISDALRRVVFTKVHKFKSKMMNVIYMVAPLIVYIILIVLELGLELDYCGFISTVCRDYFNDDIAFIGVVFIMPIVYILTLVIGNKVCIKISSYERAVNYRFTMLSASRTAFVLTAVTTVLCAYISFNSSYSTKELDSIRDSSYLTIKDYNSVTSELYFKGNSYENLKEIGAIDYYSPEFIDFINTNSDEFSSTIFEESFIEEFDKTFEQCFYEMYRKDGINIYIYLIAFIWFILAVILDIIYEYSKNRESYKQISNGDFQKRLCTIFVRANKRLIISTCVMIGIMCSNINSLVMQLVRLINESFTISYTFSLPGIFSKDSFMGTIVDMNALWIIYILISIGIVYLIINIYLFYCNTKSVSKEEAVLEEVLNDVIVEKKVVTNPFMPEEKYYDYGLVMETFAKRTSDADKAIEEGIKSEKMKVELISNVSHDLKTPLTSIISYIDLIKKEELEPVMNDYVDVLADKSQKLKGMIESLFDLAKTSSGNAKLKIEEIDMNRLVEQIVADMDDIIKQSSNEVKLELEDIKATFMADSNYMYRVCQNLIGNALKYSLEGTRIYIRTSYLDGLITLEITNTAGYEMNFTEKSIIERFVRGDEERSTEGNGLGLAIANTYTQACGGVFKVKIDGDQFRASIVFPSSDSGMIEMK